MTRSSILATVLFATALAGCDAGVSTTQTVPLKGPAGAQRPAEPAKPASAAPGKPAAAAPAKPWTSVDAKGHDWASHMGAIRFDTDWQAGMKRARATNTPIMFLFTQKVCPDCVKLGATALKDPRIVDAAKAFVPLIVDVEDNAPLADRYGAQLVPMIVYASPTGDALASTIDVCPVEEMLRDVKVALDALKEDAEGAK